MNSPREVIKKGSQSFALASLFLPAQVQTEVYTLYGFFRHCDDVIDNSQSEMKDLDFIWSQTFDPGPGPNFVPIQDLIKKRNIPAYYFIEFFEGLRMDAANRRYRTFEELQSYCYRVASVVGLIMCPLIGVTHPAALKHASSLAIGMQLTNICRDVLEDSLNNRIYLPQDWFLNPLTADEISKSPESLYPVVLRVLDQADSLYRDGNLGLKYLPFRVAMAIGCASFIYREIGQRIRANGPKSLKKRTIVSRTQKIKCILMGLFTAVASRFQRTQGRPASEGLPLLSNNHL